MKCDIAQQSHAGLRVLVADDHPILRDGLKAILKEKNMQVVGEVSDGLQAIKLCEELAPDVAVVDVSMPLLNGIDATREIRKVSPKTKIMILTMHTEERYVAAALRVGVSGYVLKSKAASHLTQAIDAAINGEVYIGLCVSRSSANMCLASQSPTGSLSGRERGVLQLIAERKNVKEVGDLLGISTKTAESHRANIMRKLGIHDVAGLVRHAIKEGLTHID